MICGMGTAPAMLTKWTFIFPILIAFIGAASTKTGKLSEIIPPEQRKTSKKCFRSLYLTGDKAEWSKQAMKKAFACGTTKEGAE